MNATVMRIGWRTIVGRRRGLVILLLPLLLLALCALLRFLVEPSPSDAFDVPAALGLSTVLPLVALIATSSVISPELEDGSIAYLLSKPIPRRSIVLSKLVVVLAVTLVGGVLPIVLGMWVLTPTVPELVLGMLAGTVAMSLAYASLFTALATSTKHAVLAGIGYIFLVEGVLGGLMPGMRWLSIGRWGNDLVHQVWGTDAGRTDVPLWYSLTAIAGVTVAGVVWATRRLSRYNLTGGE